MTDRTYVASEIKGRRVGEEPDDESEHFIECRECGQMIDMRDPGEVLAHEGPHLPPLKM